MAALSHYIRWLPEKHMSFWLCRDKWVNAKWPHNTQLFDSDKIKFHVFDKNKKREILQTCDIIFYQPNFETLNIIKENSNSRCQKTIDISPIFVDDIEFIERKETKYNTLIRVSEIIKKNKNINLYTKKHNHPCSFLFLEIIKELCDIINVKYYNQETYDSLIKKQYPNY